MEKPWCRWDKFSAERQAASFTPATLEQSSRQTDCTLHQLSMLRTVKKLKSCRSRVFAKSNTVPSSKLTATNMILFEWEVNLQMGGFTVLDDNHVQHANVPHKSADHTVIFWCFFRSQAAIPQLHHFRGGSFTTLQNPFQK